MIITRCVFKYSRWRIENSPQHIPGKSYVRILLNRTLSVIGHICMYLTNIIHNMNYLSTISVSRNTLQHMLTEVCSNNISLTKHVLGGIVYNSYLLDTWKWGETWEGGEAEVARGGKNFNECVEGDWGKGRGGTNDIPTFTAIAGFSKVYRPVKEKEHKSFGHWVVFQTVLPRGNLDVYP